MSKMLKNFPKEFFIFISSIFFVLFAYIFWHHVHSERKFFVAYLHQMESALKNKNKIVSSIEKVVRSMEGGCLEDPRKFSKLALGTRFKFLASQASLSFMEFTVMPENISQQGKNSFVIRRVCITLKFSSYLDTYVWDFIQSIYDSSPGLFFMKEFRLERILAPSDKQKGFGISHILAGYCVFEWTSIGFAR